MPLGCDAAVGHEGVVKPFQGQEDVGPDKPVNQNSTPLSSALDNGHEGAGKLLLGRESVAPNRPGESYRTPPQCALEEHEAVIKPPPKPDSVVSQPSRERSNTIQVCCRRTK